MLLFWKYFDKNGLLNFFGKLKWFNGEFSSNCVFIDIFGVCDVMSFVLFVCLFFDKEFIDFV